MWSQGSSQKRQLHPASPPTLSPGLPFSLTTGWTNSSPALALSGYFFYLKFFLCFTAPSLNKHTLKITWTHVVKSCLQEVKNPHTTGRPKGNLLRASAWPLTLVSTIRGAPWPAGCTLAASYSINLQYYCHYTPCLLSEFFSCKQGKNRGMWAHNSGLFANTQVIKTPIL